MILNYLNNKNSRIFIEKRSSILQKSIVVLSHEFIPQFIRNFHNISVSIQHNQNKFELEDRENVIVTSKRKFVMKNKRAI